MLVARKPLISGEIPPGESWDTGNNVGVVSEGPRIVGRQGDGKNETKN